MTPVFLYAMIAGGAAYALHKRKWGWFFFACAALLWLVLMMILNTYMAHGSVFQS